MREPIGRILGLCALAISAALFVVATAKVLLVLFAGVLLAIILRSSAVWLSGRLHLRTGVCLAAIAVILVGGSGAIAVIGLPKAAEQLDMLRQQLPEVLSSLRGHWLGHLVLSPQKGPGGSLGQEPQMAVKAAVSAVGGSIEVLASLVIVFFVGLYGAAQPQLYVSAFIAVTPERQRDRMARALDGIQRSLTRWLLARLVAMTFVGVTTIIAFSVLDLPLATTLGLLAGLLTFIEYAGAIVSAIPPLAFALAKSTSTALWVLGLYTALHVIEGYVLTPLLSRLAVRLPPAFTLASQALLGLLLGPLGLTFSTPLLVAAVAAVKTWCSHGR